MLSAGATGQRAGPERCSCRRRPFATGIVAGRLAPPGGLLHAAVPSGTPPRRSSRAIGFRSGDHASTMRTRPTAGRSGSLGRPRGQHGFRSFSRPARESRRGILRHRVCPRSKEPLVALGDSRHGLGFLVDGCWRGTETDGAATGPSCRLLPGGWWGRARTFTGLTDALSSGSRAAPDPVKVGGHPTRRVSAPMPTPDHRRLCSSSGTERCSAPTCRVVAGGLRAGFSQTTR